MGNFTHRKQALPLSLKKQTRKEFYWRFLTYDSVEIRCWVDDAKLKKALLSEWKYTSCHAINQTELY